MTQSNNVVEKKNILNLQQAQGIMLNILKIFDAICQEHNLPYWLEAGTLLGAIRHQGFIPWDDDLDVSMLRKDFQRFLKVAPKALPDYLFLQTEKTEKDYFNPAIPAKIRDLNSRIIPFDPSEFSGHPGIFIDIFPYDSIPYDYETYKTNKKQARKLLKTKREKIKAFQLGQTNLKYWLLGKTQSLTAINQHIQNLIDACDADDSEQVGYGYDFTSPIMLFPRKSIFPLVKKPFEDGEFWVPGDYDTFLNIKFGDYMKLPPIEKRVGSHAAEFRVNK